MARSSILDPQSSILDPLSSGEAGVQVVPPFDAFLAEAENLLSQGYEGRERVRILKAPRDAAAARILAREFGFGGHPAERRAGTVDARQQSSDFGQQCVRFFDGKEFHRVSIWKVVRKTVCLM